MCKLVKISTEKTVIVCKKNKKEVLKKIIIDVKIYCRYVSMDVVAWTAESALLWAGSLLRHYRRCGFHVTLSLSRLWEIYKKEGIL